MPPSGAAGDRDRLLGLLERFGAQPESFCLRYEAPWRYVFGREVEAGAAYLERERVGLVWGDPLCEAEDAAGFLDEMVAELHRRGLHRIALLLVDEAVARAALARGFGVLKIGEQPLFDLDGWRVPRGNAGKHLRWCLNGAHRAGLTVAERAGGDAEFDGALASLVDHWEAALGRTPTHSFLRASPLVEAERKLIFVARSERGFEAALACTPYAGGSSWFLEDLIRRGDAPVGATELLVIDALARLRERGVTTAALDIAPLRGSTGQLDRRAQALVFAARPVLAFFDVRYHFRARASYAAKFVPSRWQPRYVALLPPWPTAGVIRAATALL